MFNSNKLYFLADFDIIVGDSSPVNVDKSETKMMEKLRAPKRINISFTVDLYKDYGEETWHRNFKFNGDKKIYYPSEGIEEYMLSSEKLEFKYEIDFHNDSKYRIYSDGEIYEDEWNDTEKMGYEYDTLDDALEYSKKLRCQYAIVRNNKIVYLKLRCARRIPLRGDWDDSDNVYSRQVPYFIS